MIRFPPSMKRNFLYHPLLMFTVTMKVAWQPFLCFYLSKPLNLRLIAYLTNMTSIHITTMLPMIPLLHFRSPTLPTWPALLAAKRLSTLPPSWASRCHSVSLFKIIAVKNAIQCHIATFTLPPSRCHSVSQSSKLFSKPIGMKKVIQWQLLSLSPLSLFTLITFTFISLQRWCPSWCQWSPCADHLWGLHLAHRQLQQLLHEQLHTSGEIFTVWNCNTIPSSIQFNYYLARGCQTNPFQLKLFSDWMQADKLFWR